ncbi:MAG: hypothetical protein IKC28_00075 [Clostridia bacterium]|nr:hypothetical protein [Clostridia bacterium]
MKKRLISIILTVFLLVISNFAIADTINECILVVQMESIEFADVFLDHMYKEIKENSTTHVNYGDYFNVSAAPSTKVSHFYYYWDDDANNINTINESSFILQVPLEFEVGSTHSLTVGACFVNDVCTKVKCYNFVIEENNNVISPEELSEIRSYTTNSYGKLREVIKIPINSHLFVEPSTILYYGYPSYYWDNRDKIELEGSRAKQPIEIPTDFEVGSTHTLTICSSSEDGRKSTSKTYTITFLEAEDDFD